MVNELNLSLIEGRLTRDPELIFTKNGNQLCKFDIAVNFSRKTDDKVYSEVSFITVNTWKKIAEVCAQYLKKGSKVRVRGRIKQDSWTDNDGKKKNKIHIEASGVDFLGSPKNEEQSFKEVIA